MKHNAIEKVESDTHMEMPELCLGCGSVCHHDVVAGGLGWMGQCSYCGNIYLIRWDLLPTFSPFDKDSTKPLSFHLEAAPMTQEEMDALLIEEDDCNCNGYNRTSCPTCEAWARRVYSD